MPQEDQLKNKTRHVIKEERKGDTDNEGTELGITLEAQEKTLQQWGQKR